MVVSILALESATEEFLQGWNESPNPFVWTATVESSTNSREAAEPCKKSSRDTPSHLPPSPPQRFGERREDDTSVLRILPLVGAGGDSYPCRVATRRKGLAFRDVNQSVGSRSCDVHRVGDVLHHGTHQAPSVFAENHDRQFAAFPILLVRSICVGRKKHVKPASSAVFSSHRSLMCPTIVRLLL